MTFPRQDELNKLADKIRNGLSAEEMEALARLNQEMKDWQEEQKANLNQVIENIKQYGIPLSSLVGKAFDIKELRKTAIQFNLIADDQADAVEQNKAGAARAQKSGPVVFTFEKVGGFRSSQIRQDSTPPATPNDSHIAFFLKPGKTLDKLMALKEANKENEAFLTSEAGKALVNTWTTWFDTKVEKYLSKHPEKATA